jgi:hypothetical protein
VAAEVSPHSARYELRRIGIIAFVNQSGTPDAGVRVATLFFHTLEAHHRFELTPPLLRSGKPGLMRPKSPCSTTCCPWVAFRRVGACGKPARR